MGFIADLLLFSGALGASFYCFVLSHRRGYLGFPPP